jgi:hypothetical protein
MAELILSIPDEMMDKINKYPEFNWKSIAKKAIQRKIKDLEFYEYFTAQSSFTAEDVLSLGKDINKGLCQHVRVQQ